MTAQKRIIHTVTNDLNYDQRMQRICTSLTRAGFDCLLVGREKRGSAALANQVFSQKRLFCFFEKGPLFYAEFNLRLFCFLLKNRFDILNTIDLDTMPGGLFAAYLKNKKRVFDAHEYFSEVPEVFNRMFIKKVWETIGDTLIPRYHACYTVGECLADIFTKKYGLKFETIRNVPFRLSPTNFQDDNNWPRQVSHDCHSVGICPSSAGIMGRFLRNDSRGKLDISAFTETEISEQCTTHSKLETRNSKLILYQGALNAGRGLESAILAMKHIDFAEIWLAGEGDLSGNLRKMVAENGLGSRVKFLGYVRPDALPALTKQAWLGLNLLEMNGLSYYYSLANKFFDYVQNGVPSLNMEFPEYQKICAAHEVGLLLKDCQPERIVAAVHLLKTDEDLYQKLVGNCLRAAKIYNWEHEAVKLIEIYGCIDS